MLYLIGFMGVGKSTIGLELAKQCNLPFIDTDKEIEKREGKDIANIFKTKGENYFRNIESIIIRNIKQKSIIACGGGLPLSNNNIQYLQSQGNSIYLKASEKTLYRRLKKRINIRPLIFNKSDDELKEFIKKNLKMREVVYKKADHTINIDNLKKEHILREIHTLPISL